jgi:hypothetical protein
MSVIVWFKDSPLQVNPQCDNNGKGNDKLNQVLPYFLMLKESRKYKKVVEINDNQREEQLKTHVDENEIPFHFAIALKEGKSVKVKRQIYTPKREV